jgi:L-lactate dehydrogenase complex protein LldE
MSTCLCDAFFDDVARATVEVLEHLGCTVEFPERQTCCGQPAFNAGDWPAARTVLRHAVDVFAGEAPVVIPSASCAAMLSHGAQILFENEPDVVAVKQLGTRAWELTDFIVRGLGVTSWPGRFAGRVAFHRSCHSRGSGTGDAVSALLRSVSGLEFVDFDEAEQCCGFGGTFSVAFASISTAMGTLKLDNLLAAKPDVIVSTDMSCLLHLRGLAERQGRPLRALHVAQVLRDALASSEVGR